MMSALSKISVGVVGCGYWGPNLIRNFAALREASLVAVCDLNAEKLASQVSAYPGVRGFTSLSSMLSEVDLDAVVVATAAHTHYHIAKEVLLKGKHVFVEKPLTLSSSEAAELVKLAQSRGLILMVGHLLKYHPGLAMVKQYVDSGELGEIRYLYSQRVNLGIVRSEENALWSLAPHDIAVMCYLVGSEPEEVSANGAAYLQPGIEDVVFATIKFCNGVMANLHVSWLDPHKIRKLTVVGSRKMVVFDDMSPSQKVILYDKGVDQHGTVGYPDSLSIRSGDIFVPQIETTEPLKLECQHFLDCIKRGQTPLSDGLDGLRVVKILEAADRSLKSGGKPVPIDDLPGSLL
jgi:predicted dehydrogenase